MANNFTEKLRMSGSSLVNKLRGFNVPSATIVPPSQNALNNPIFDEINALHEQGTPLSKIKKAIDVMALPNAEEIKKFARNLFFNSELTESENNLTKPSVIKDEELQTEIQAKYIKIAEEEIIYQNNKEVEDIVGDFDNLKNKLNKNFGMNIDEFRDDVKELKSAGIDKKEILDTVDNMPIKNRKIGLKIIEKVFQQ